MGDSYNALSVALAKNIDQDDIGELVKAIKMLRGVIDVKPHAVDLDSFTAEARARHDLGEKLFNTVYGK